LKINDEFALRKHRLRHIYEYVLHSFEFILFSDYHKQTLGGADCGQMLDTGSKKTLSKRE
ncbi:MAG: hypothetical protein ACTTIT_08545, partial [Treponema sp.]